MAIYSWYDLSWKEQRAVLRLARQGRRHPNSEVATVADEWAREKLGKDNGKGGALATAIFGGLFGDGTSLGEGLRDYRRAKRIVRVAERR